MYAEATEKMEMLTNEKSTTHMGKAETTMECWNCGSKNHIKSNCSRPPHKCSVCKKVRYLEKHCFEKKDSKMKESKPSGYKKGLSGGPKKKGNKTLRREAMVRKAKVHMAEAEDDEAEEEAYYVEEDEEEDYDEDEESYQGYMVRINKDEEKEEKEET
jgi:hypothetical protein